MKGSGGKKRRKYIKSNRFNEIFKRYIHEFYVNKYMKPSDFSEKYNIPSSSFSETKIQVYNAIGKGDDRQKRGGTERIFELTENQKSRNPFLSAYLYCIDSDSDFFLYILIAFFIVGCVSEELCNLFPKVSNNKYWTIDDIEKELRQNSDVNITICNALGCSSDFKEANCNCGCLASALISMCKNYKDRTITISDFKTIIKSFFEDDEDFGNRYASVVTSADYNTLKAKFDRLVQFGYLESHEGGYRLNQVNLDALLGGNNSDDFYLRFCSFIEFCSELIPFGSIGYSIFDELKNSNYCHPFRFRHRFVINSINDYSLINIEYAINNKLWLKVTSRNNNLSNPLEKTLYVYPLCVFQSTRDGRQYLVAFFPDKGSVSSMRIDYFTDVRICDAVINDADLFEKYIGKAQLLLRYAWNASFEQFDEGNCRMVDGVVLYELLANLKIPSDELYLEDRIRREFRNVSFSLDKTGDSSYKLRGIISSDKGIVSWLNSYIPYIETVKTERVFMNDMGQLIENKSDIMLPIISVEKHVEKDVNPCIDYLFCQENGMAYQKLSALFIDGVNHGFNTDDLSCVFDAIVDRKKNGEIIHQEYIDELSSIYINFNKQIREGIYKDVMARNSSKFFMPLSWVKQEWINMCLSSEFALLFFDNYEIDKMKASVGTSLNLFGNNIVRYFDQSNNVITVQADIFRKILMAILYNQSVKLTYRKNEKNTSKNNGVYFLDSMNYSRRENTWILYAYNLDDSSPRILRVDRISDVEIVQREEIDRSKVERSIENMIDYSKSQFGVLKIGLIETEKNIVDRFFRDISDLSYECKRNKTVYSSFEDKVRAKQNLLDGNRLYLNGFNFSVPNVDKYKDDDFEYLVTIHYPGNDYKELVHKLFSYGNELFIFDNESDEGYENLQRGDVNRKHSVLHEIKRQISAVINV